MKINNKTAEETILELLPKFKEYYYLKCKNRYWTGSTHLKIYGKLKEYFIKSFEENNINELEEIIKVIEYIYRERDNSPKRSILYIFIESMSDYERLEELKKYIPKELQKFKIYKIKYEDTEKYLLENIEGLKEICEEDYNECGYFPEEYTIVIYINEMIKKKLERGEKEEIRKIIEKIGYMYENGDLLTQELVLFGFIEGIYSYERIEEIKELCPENIRYYLDIYIELGLIGLMDILNEEAIEKNKEEGNI